MRARWFALLGVFALTGSAVADPTQADSSAVSPSPTPSLRPDGFSIGIGLGYLFEPGPAGPQNVQTVRIRLRSGLTFEPYIQVSSTSITGSSSYAETDFGIGVAVRVPLLRRGRADFEMIGAAATGTARSPQTATASSSADLDWGLGVGYWLSPHWQVSLTATNPLVGYSSNSTTSGPNTMKTTDRELMVGWAPDVTAMIHLYL